MNIHITKKILDNPHFMKATKYIIIVTYGITFTSGSYYGYKMAMTDWYNIEKNNLKLNMFEKSVQYFHTGSLTLLGGISGCIMLILSPIIVPIIYYIDKSISKKSISSKSISLKSTSIFKK